MTIKFLSEKDFLNAISVYYDAFKDEIKDQKAAKLESVLMDCVFHDDAKPDTFWLTTTRSLSWIFEYDCNLNEVNGLMAKIRQIGFLVKKAKKTS